MSALVSEKAAHKTDSPFCWSGLIRKISSSKRSRSCSIDARQSTPHLVEVPAPPPYKSSPPPSDAILAPHDAEAKARRPRRLSKQRDSVYAPNALGSAHTSISSVPSPSSPSSSSSPTRQHRPKSQHLDSSGRPRPPISGVSARSPSSTSASGGGNAATTGHGNGHDYHYKRARTTSSSEATRVQEAILCLQAVLDACEAGAVKDMRHIVEQVELARNILVGEDVAAVLGSSSSGGSGGEDTPPSVVAPSTGGGGGLVASASVTSIATIPSYMTSRTVLRV